MVPYWLERTNIPRYLLCDKLIYDPFNHHIFDAGKAQLEEASTTRKNEPAGERQHRMESIAGQQKPRETTVGGSTEISIEGNKNVVTVKGDTHIYGTFF